MDANYWPAGLPINAPPVSRNTGVDAGKMGLHMPSVMDLGQPVNLQYGSVDANSAASLEFFFNQQRLAASGTVHAHSHIYPFIVELRMSVILGL